jgi:predicted ribosomally synthesized peptide with nif11-like leader
MSVESAKAFVKRAMQEEEFATQLVALESDEARQQFATDAGYEFTVEELQQLLPGGVTVDQLRGLQKSDELPDEVMEAVVGGKGSEEQFWVGVGVGIAIDAVVTSAAMAAA